MSTTGMKKGIKLYFGVLALIICSCRHTLDASAYVKYIQDSKNGLKKIMQTDGWEYAIQYKPYDYILLFESKGKMKKDEVAKRKEEMKGTVWFNISFKRIDGSISPMRYNLTSLEEYNVRLNYFLNEAQKEIVLVYGKDTLRPNAYLFENNYNLTPQETIVVGFTLPRNEERPRSDMLLSYNDPLFKNGIIKMNYTQQAISSIPNLIY